MSENITKQKVNMLFIVDSINNPNLTREIQYCDLKTNSYFTAWREQLISMLLVHSAGRVNHHLAGQCNIDMTIWDLSKV
jgi:hypothetical protein